jgi:hypothetical protein
VRDVDTATATTHADVHGIFYYDLSLTEMQVLDWYEGVGDGEYTRTDCHVLVPQQQQQQQQQEAVVQVATQVYVWNDVADESQTQLHMDRDWSYEHFRDNHLDAFLENTVRPCREELDRLGM